MEGKATQKAAGRIGIISAWWLPKFGGAEQYLYRMATGLSSLGLDIKVFCGTGQKTGFDNGQITATRFVPKGDLEIDFWRSSFTDRTPENLKAVSNHFIWFSEAVVWCKKNSITTVLICNPFQQVTYFHAHELHMRLKDAGIAVGIVHHDLPVPIERFLNQVYRDSKMSWEQVSDYALAELGKALKAKPGLEGYLEIGSPLAFSPDFIVSNSDWALRFIDPLKTQKRFVFHGPIDVEHLRQKTTAITALSAKDVLMINPQNRKGPAEMRDLIGKGRETWTYRVLKGSWGDSFKTFRPLVRELKASKENRVEFVEYVKDIRTAYAAAKVVFFPSHNEGYGLAAVEPMFMGTPVVSSNYPAIFEAVGDAAKLLCPLKNTAEEWRDAVADVLDNHEVWSQKALARAEELSERQTKQFLGLSQFLLKQSQS